MNDLVSIIMPAYNSEKYIKKSIKSIINQTYKNWELIVVDDASTDNTIKIARQQKNKKIKIIKSKKNNGAAISRNIGIKNSIGRYIAFLDSDDEWNKNKLEKQIKYMKKKNYSFTYTSFYYKKNNELKFAKIPASLNYKQSLKNTIILTSTVIIDTKIISKQLIMMPNIKRGQDTATWWNILKNGYTANGIMEPLTIYTIRKNSLSNNKIIALKRTWNLYRKHEKLNVFKTIYYFIFYIINAIKKRIF